MKKILFSFTLSLCSFLLTGQTNTSTFFTTGAKINTSVSNGSFHYKHTIEKGHTIYSLSKIFHLSTTEIYEANNMNRVTPLGLGQILTIPLSEKNIITTPVLNHNIADHYIPIYYTVQPKETLYSIAKVYFQQSIEDMMTRNRLSSTALNLGQDLLIGWLPIGNYTMPTNTTSKIEQSVAIEQTQPNSTTEDAVLPINTTTETDGEIDLDIESEILTDTISITPDEGFNVSLLGNKPYDESMKIIKKRQVAYWDKSIPDNGTVFALHESAELDTYILLYNNLVKRSVRAKVIGRIPYGTYTSDVKLVLSPRAAIQLGARNRRFSVEIEAIVKK